MRNIVLIGLPGSGKTLLGRQLAARIGWPFRDLDEWIEARAGQTIPQIFSGYGEAFFRELEAHAVSDAARTTGQIIATGGGTVLSPDNIRALRKNGLLLFLDRPAGQILLDIDPAARPLLAAAPERLYEIERLRRPLYLAAADHIIDCAGPFAGLLPSLLQIIQQEGVKIPA